jgi:nucleotide-binding universal stress UspA family protein
VVVGIDGSARSLQAVDSAVAQAALHHRPLRIVLAMSWPSLPVAGPPGVVPEPPPAVREQAEAALAEAVRQAEKAVPPVTVTGEVRTGAPVPVLLDESRGAYRMVIGDRGHGGFAGLLAGSVAVHLTAHGACPVVVVRGERRPAGPVVVGMDGSALSAEALDFAVEEAALRGAELVAVHAWLPPPVVGPVGLMPVPPGYEPQVLAAEEQRVLAEALAGIGSRYPDVTIRRESLPGAPAKVLRDRSETAQLVVVGSRGRGAFTGMLLGSVGQHLIHHAACPVAVIRPAA